MADTNGCNCLEQESQIDSELSNVSQLDSTFDEPMQMTSTMENVIEVKVTPHFSWLEFQEEDWQADGEDYTISIPFSTHKCLNAYVAEMQLINEDGSKENPFKSYKLLANDTMVIKSDKRIHCKVLIKGDR